MVMLDQLARLLEVLGLQPCQPKPADTKPPPPTREDGPRHMLRAWPDEDPTNNSRHSRPTASPWN